MERAQQPGADLGAPPSLEEAYASCTPLLISAVGRLARQGYRLDPSDSLDMIHDFYLEALPGLFDRYDSTQGRFSTYVYGAFLRFARPRIVRTLRSRAMFHDLDAVLDHPTIEHTTEFSDAQTQSMAKAVQKLPRALRTVVVARFVEGLSERDLSKKLNRSRYLVRQQTAEALGRLAVALGEDKRIPQDVRPLATRLWRDERPLMSVAKELGLSRTVARSKYAGLLKSLTKALL